MPMAPLFPIPTIEPPFSHLIFDIVRPLPSTGKCYLLSIIDPATHYLEAIPIRFVKSKVVVKCLLEFFSKFGLPQETQLEWLGI